MSPPQFTGNPGGPGEDRRVGVAVATSVVNRLAGLTTTMDRLSSTDPYAATVHRRALEAARALLEHLQAQSAGREHTDPDGAYSAGLIAGRAAKGVGR